MKLFALFLLVPAIAVAQAPGGQMDRGKLLKQMKQSMLPVIEQSLPELEKTRECVQASSNSAQLRDCAAIMEAFQKRMIAKSGRAEGGGHTPPAAQDKPEINWSPEIQKNLLKGLDVSIQKTSAMKGCLQSSQTPEQMDSCMQESGLAGPPRRKQ